MDIYAALDLIRLACNHQHDYNDHTRKSLLTGIHELADSCIASIQERDDLEQYEHAQIELELIKGFSETGLQSGDLATAFVHIRETVWRVIPPADDSR